MNKITGTENNLEVYATNFFIWKGLQSTILAICQPSPRAVCCFPGWNVFYYFRPFEEAVMVRSEHIVVYLLKCPCLMILME